MNKQIELLKVWNSGKHNLVKETQGFTENKLPISWVINGLGDSQSWIYPVLLTKFSQLQSKSKKVKCDNDWNLYTYVENQLLLKIALFDRLEATSLMNVYIFIQEKWWKYIGSIITMSFIDYPSCDLWMLRVLKLEITWFSTKINNIVYYTINQVRGSLYKFSATRIKFFKLHVAQNYLSNSYCNF